MEIGQAKTSKNLQMQLRLLRLSAFLAKRRSPMTFGLNIRLTPSLPGVCEPTLQYHTHYPRQQPASSPPGTAPPPASNAKKDEYLHSGHRCVLSSTHYESHGTSRSVPIQTKRLHRQKKIDLVPPQTVRGSRGTLAHCSRIAKQTGYAALVKANKIFFCNEQLTKNNASRCRLAHF